MITIFIILCLGNLHEIIFNLVHLIEKIDPDDPDKGNQDNDKPFYTWNLISEFYCDIYIGTIFVLCWLTFTKLKIETKIYY